MKNPGHSRLIAASAALLLASGVATPANAFLGFFEKGGKKAPAAGELATQEQAASALLQKAVAQEASGNVDRAADAYESIQRQYPFTNSAADAGFRRAALVRHTGKLQDAFDLLQTFIDEYRSSPRFTEAVQLQYELAEEAKGGKKQRSVLLINMKIGTEDLVGMYKQVITNAPFGKFAPLAQFSIAEIYQDKGEKEKSIRAYQQVVDNYPNTKEASEALFRIGAISNIAIKKTQDSGNVVDTRDALNTYMATNPDGQRASEVKAMLSAVDEVEAARSLQTGKFYLRQSKPKAAAIYFNEALKYGSAESAAEARVLLAELATQNPEAVAETRTSPDTDYTPPGAANLKSRDEYAGPPSPELARLTQKPQMRAEDAKFMPIPLQEPELPSGAPVAPPSGGLLPTMQGREPSLLLPVPPAPTVPPAPAATGAAPSGEKK